jgi:hypothetical protein
MKNAISSLDTELLNATPNLSMSLDVGSWQDRPQDAEVLTDIESVPIRKLDEATPQASQVNPVGQPKPTKR